LPQANPLKGETITLKGVRRRAWGTRERVRFDPLKVLLVDDNHHMRLLLTEMLRAIGVRHIFEALDGMEAMSTMRRVRSTWSSPTCR
jgi:PleD family two-component response regulator